MEKSSGLLDRLVPDVERLLDNAGQTLLRVGKVAAKLAFVVTLAFGADTIVGVATADRPVEIIDLPTE